MINAIDTRKPVKFDNVLDIQEWLISTIEDLKYDRSLMEKKSSIEKIQISINAYENVLSKLRN